MQTNPLHPGALTENGLGIGAVSRRLIRERAAELALINERPVHEIAKADWDQAKRELGGGGSTSPFNDFLDSIAESDRWNLVPGSSGR